MGVDNKKIKEQVSKLDICPLCKTKITETHLKEVYDECDVKITTAEKNIVEWTEIVEKKKSEAVNLRQTIHALKEQLDNSKIESVKLENINEKKERIKRFYNQEKELLRELEDLNKKLKYFEVDFKNYDSAEDLYEMLLRQIEDISSRTDDNIDLEIKYKQNELEKMRTGVKQAIKDDEQLANESEEVKKLMVVKESELESHDKKEKELSEKFKKLFEKRDSLQIEIQKETKESLLVRHEMEKYEMVMNNLKIDKAKVDAEEESYTIELKEYEGVEIIKASINELSERLTKTSEELNATAMGGVNMRALEVYEGVRQQYEEVAKKAETLVKEKEEIMSIITEIEKKKKITFMKTFEAMNTIFTNNFLQLSSKGEAYLELENTEDPFAAGVNIIIRIARGKYFDVSSLSGGEKTLVALSLIFAIQEYKPYSFYIFDEVDAALDKRNSEKLAQLVKKHMKSGQYIIVTHNDALITESTTLYGISMQDGVSKVLSLKV